MLAHNGPRQGSKRQIAFSEGFEMFNLKISWIMIASKRLKIIAIRGTTSPSRDRTAA